MRISIIVAIDNDNAIGADNKLIYWLPNDLKRFKALTTGNTIIMGRKTFESLPKGALPNRRNIVISRNSKLKCEGADVFHSLKDALDNCRENERVGENSDVFIIGGASIYKQALFVADRLCLTVIDAHSDMADTFFPEIDKNVWAVTSVEEHDIDEKHKFKYKFVDMERKKTASL